jgi:D-glycero-alpha-D-manno-heptose 1-phosphate guanylyltransferase
MEAIILAGGLGTRLNSKLAKLPKSMAPIAGRPFLEILLDQLIGAGCTRVILSVGHLRHIILEAFRESYRGVPLKYVAEETPLGTGGAIRLALQYVQEPSVLVLNGDTYLDANFSAMLALHLCAGRPITMAITQVEDMERYGGVVIDNEQVLAFIEKGRKGPGWINAGAYILSRNFPWPEHLPSQFSFETDVLAPFLGRLCPTAFLCDGYFLDIGIPEDLDRAQVELTARNRNMPY